MYIKESYLNATEGYRMGDSEWYETFTDNLGDLYRFLRKEFGRPSNMYCNLKDGGCKKIGWVFRGKDKYEDTGKPYTREVWVEVSKTKPKFETAIKNVNHPF